MTHDPFNTVFMYSGQGSQYFNMGKELYENEEVFRYYMNKCCSFIDDFIEVPLLSILYPAKKQYNEFDNILYTHPSIFSFQYSLTMLLYSKGVFPDAVIGYSLGEIVGAVVSGVLSLEDGLSLVMKQALMLYKSRSNGGMLVVLGDISIITPLHLFPKLSLAAENYNGNFVLSGNREDLISAKNYLSNFLLISSVLLPVKYSFHSAGIDFLKDQMLEHSEGIIISKPQIPLFSSALAGQVTHPTAEYFWSIARNQIRFSDLISNIINIKKNLFVDLSATGSLTNFIKIGFPSIEHVYPTINQFGQNTKTLNSFLSKYPIS